MCFIRDDLFYLIQMLLESLSVLREYIQLLAYGTRTQHGARKTVGTV